MAGVETETPAGTVVPSGKSNFDKAKRLTLTILILVTRFASDKDMYLPMPMGFNLWDSLRKLSHLRSSAKVADVQVPPQESNTV